MGRVDGKVALVTGAGRGMGRSHVLTLAREGADILALDVDTTVENIPYDVATSAELASVAAEVEAMGRRIIAVEGDVRHQADLDRLVARGIDEFGQIDIVVANAGVWSLGEFWKLSEAEWATVFDVNTAGVWRTVKAAAPHMIERRQGSIILISSMNGLEAGYGNAHYTASKHAVTGFMKSVAYELGPHNVRCNAILPGAIDTPMHKWQGFYDMVAGGEGLGTPEHREAAGRGYHLLPGRGMLPPQAISNAVLWLASDEAAEVTGLEMKVDAGHMIMPGLNGAMVAETALREAAQKERRDG